MISTESLIMQLVESCNDKVLEECNRRLSSDAFFNSVTALYIYSHEGAETVRRGNTVRREGPVLPVIMKFISLVIRTDGTFNWRYVVKPSQRVAVIARRVITFL